MCGVRLPPLRTWGEEICGSGNVEIWGSGALWIWGAGGLEIFGPSPEILGDLDICGGDLGIWSSRDLENWGDGDRETWGSGDLAV